MSSTDQHDEAAEPSTEVAVREELAEVRAELEQIRNAPVPATRRVTNSLDEWVTVVRDYNMLAQSLAKTDFVPKDFKGKPDQITATMMYGREIGLPPMTTLQNTHVIHGRVGMYAEQLRAMILAAGHEYEIEETTSDRCVISGRRKGSERWQQHEYTMDRAKLSGLYAQNEQYKKRPTEMLLARASGIMAHAQFPDVIRGMGAIEELEAEGEPDNAPVAPAVKATATVGRKKATPKALGTGAAPSNEPGLAVGTPAPAIPDEPGIPPLPGEDGYDEPSAAATAESDAGAARAAQSADADPRVHAAPASTPQSEGGAASPPADTGAANTPAAESANVKAAPSSVMISTDRTERLAAGMKAAGITRKQEALDYVMSVIGRDVASRDELTVDEAEQVIDALGRLVASEALPVPGEEDLPPEVEHEDRPRMITRAQQRGMFATFNTLGINDDEERLRITAAIVGRTPMHKGVPSSNGLTEAEFKTLVDALARCKTRDHVDALVELAEQEHAAGGEQS